MKSINNFRVLEPIRQCVINQMWFLSDLIEIYEYCTNTEQEDLKYIDDVPFSQYFAKFLDNFNREQRKKNTQAIVGFVEQMKESLEKQDEASSTYAFMSNSNSNFCTHKQASREITIENLMQNINSQLSKSKKKF